MRKDLARARAELDRAAGKDNAAWIAAAAKIAAIGWLLVYVRTAGDEAQKRKA